MKKLNLTLFFISFLFFTIGLSSQTKIGGQKDDWSGKYQIKIPEQNTTIQTVYIEKTLNVNLDNIAEKYSSDVSRWLMIIQDDFKNDSIVLRRFLINKGDNEYEDLGLSELYESGELECLDAGHFFICKTKTGITIKIGEEKFTSNTGFFGIRLHHGLFELEKIE